MSLNGSGVEGQDGGHASLAACGDGRPLSPAWPAPHLTDRSVLGEAPSVSSDPRRLRGVFLTARNPFFLDKIKRTMIKEKPPQNTGFSPTASQIANSTGSWMKILAFNHLSEITLKPFPFLKLSYQSSARKILLTRFFFFYKLFYQ
jgi:hypothetical protein